LREIPITNTPVVGGLKTPGPWCVKQGKSRGTRNISIFWHTRKEKRFHLQASDSHPERSLSNEEVKGEKKSVNVLVINILKVMGRVRDLFARVRRLKAKPASGE